MWNHRGRKSRVRVLVLPHKLKDSGSFQLCVMVFPEHGPCPHAPEWKQSFVTAMLWTTGRRKENSAESVEQRTFRDLESATQHTWLHHFGQSLFPQPCQTAKESWKWNDSSISCKVDDTLRTARIHCHRFCILRNWFFLFPVEWLLVRNPQTIPGIFRRWNFIDRIGSTGERKVDYSKCKSETTRNIARGGILASLEQEK